jgi:hypothetical protein
VRLNANGIAIGTDGLRRADIDTGIAAGDRVAAMRAKSLTILRKYFGFSYSPVICARRLAAAICARRSLPGAK